MLVRYCPICGGRHIASLTICIGIDFPTFRQICNAVVSGEANHLAFLNQSAHAFAGSINQTVFQMGMDYAGMRMVLVMVHSLLEGLLTQTDLPVDFGDLTAQRKMTLMEIIPLFRGRGLPWRNGQEKEDYKTFDWHPLCADHVVTKDYGTALTQAMNEGIAAVQSQPISDAAGMQHVMADLSITDE